MSHRSHGSNTALQHFGGRVSVCHKLRSSVHRLIRARVMCQGLPVVTRQPFCSVRSKLRRSCCETSCDTRALKHQVANICSEALSCDEVLSLLSSQIFRINEIQKSDGKSGCSLNKPAEWSRAAWLSGNGNNANSGVTFDGHVWPLHQ